MATTDGSVDLKDGRKLAFAEWGDPAGRPALLFHGTPGSRLLCPDAAQTADHSIRLISVDRPGYGNSDPNRARRLLDWPQDVVQLADLLEIDRFAVIGWSGGGPHAMACAYVEPERVTTVALAASPGPTDEVPGVMDTDIQRRMVYEGAVQNRDETTDAVMAFLEPVDGNDGQRWLDAVWELFPDATVGTNPLWKKNFNEHVIEGMRLGGEGRAEDAVVSYGPWGFSPKDVARPVFTWHGGRDVTVAKEHFDYLSSAIPSCTAFFRPDDDHGCLYNRWGEILETISAS